MPKYKNGQLVSITPKPKTRMYYIVGILGWLYFDVEQFKAGIEAQHDKSKVPKQLQILITKYCRAILHFADNYPTKSGKISIAGKNLAQTLGNELKDFDSSFLVLTSKKKVRKEIKELIHDLNAGVLWFLQQHDMIVNSIKITTPLSSNPTSQELKEFLKKEAILLKGLDPIKKVLPHRQKNWQLRDFFRSETVAYQKIKGVTRFMPFKKFLQKLDEFNQSITPKMPLTISVKGYYNLKQAWKNGTFDRLM